MTELASNPRSGLTDLAQKVDCDRQTVRRRILKLISQKVILNFGIGINHEMLGYVAYHLLFRLKPNTPKALLEKVFRGSKQFFYTGLVVGAYDLSVYLYAKSPAELAAVIKNIRNSFGHYIVNYDLLIWERVHFWKQFSSAAAEVLKRGDGE